MKLLPAIKALILGASIMTLSGDSYAEGDRIIVQKEMRLAPKSPVL